MCSLGKLCSYGEVAWNEKSAEWFEKAAELGNVDAMGYLGYCYEYGMGVTQNYDMALEWYKKAAELGNTGAEIGLERLLDRMETPSPTPTPDNIVSEG